MGMQFIIFQIVTFIVLVSIFYFLFGNQLRMALARLQALHQESLEKEEVLNKEIERAKIQSQNEILRGVEESKKLIVEARKKASAIIEEGNEQSKLETQKMIASAKEKMKVLEQEVMARVEEKALHLAQEVVRLTFTGKGKEGFHSQLIDELIEELKKVDPARLSVKTDVAEVTTSFALTEKERGNLKEILSDKLETDVRIQEKIDSALVTGIVIKLGGLVIDGSLRNKMSKVLPALREKT